MRERKRDYELMYIISPLHADDESVANIVARVRESVEAEGGEVTSVNHTPPWGRRRFAYPIRAYAGGEASRRAFTEGFYVLTHFSLPSTKVTAVERTLKLTDPILRYLITVLEPKAKYPLDVAGVSEESQSEPETDTEEETELIEEDVP